jgi:hypothetical protein
MDLFQPNTNRTDLVIFAWATKKNEQQAHVSPSPFWLNAFLYGAQPKLIRHSHRSYYLQCFILNSISFISVSNSEYLTHLEIARLAKLHCSMDNLPEALLAEIVKRLTSPSDLKSLSLLSKRLYAVEGELRNLLSVAGVPWQGWIIGRTCCQLLCDDQPV